AAQMAVGKISGAVGNASHLGTEIEERICKRLGLSVAPVTSQVIQRDRHAQYLSALALIAATLEKIALEIRHLQRTEVREAEEPFGGEQRGSSAMPHKRNPVTCEQICGLARLVRSNTISAFENIALWHERDISISTVEENAMAAWETDTSFRESVGKDARITKYLDGKALEHTFDLKRQLRYVDAIFARVFGEKTAAKKA